jgi:hypothetical protein
MFSCTSFKYCVADLETHLTLILAIQVQDGVVLASDSAMAHHGHIYFNAEKIVPLARGWPVGVAICGDGAIGTSSLGNLMKDFETRLTHRVDGIDRATYKVSDVVDCLGRFLEEAAASHRTETNSTLVITGYSAGDDLPQTWNLQLQDGKVREASPIWDRNAYGVNWDGQGACIHRLLMDLELPKRQTEPVTTARSFKSIHHSEGRIIDSPVIITPGMPILDAVEIAQFLMETSITFERYRADQDHRTIGGPIDIAVITQHSAFRWVQRKRASASRRGFGKH